MKNISVLSFIATAILIVAFGCSDVKRKRGRTYMPDMDTNRAYETYSQSPVFIDGQTNREPVPGTVKRGELLPYHLGPDHGGDSSNTVASRSVKNPLLPLSEVQLKEAERLFLINCAICHGAKLDGNGPLYNGGDGPFPAKPATLVGDAKYERMPEGEMFFSVTYGKNLMGSYAAQLDARQRWMVIAYIKSKQPQPKPATTPGDTTAAKNVAAR